MLHSAHYPQCRRMLRMSTGSNSKSCLWWAKYSGSKWCDQSVSGRWILCLLTAFSPRLDEEHSLSDIQAYAQYISTLLQVRPQAMHAKLPKYIRLPAGRTILCEGIASPACQKILDKTMGGEKNLFVTPCMQSKLSLKKIYFILWKTYAHPEGKKWAKVQCVHTLAMIMAHVSPHAQVFMTMRIGHMVMAIMHPSGLTSTRTQMSVWLTCPTM